MTKLTPSSTACAALMLLGMGAAPAANAAYTFTDLGTLGASIGSVLAINNVGQVVGNSAMGATLWDGGTATDLGTLGGWSSTAYAINDAGQVAGTSPTAGGGPSHATLWDGGIAADLGTLGGSVSEAWAINSRPGRGDFRHHG